MTQTKKRSAEPIDLTISDDDVPSRPHKVHRTSSQHAHLPTPPNSSQISRAADNEDAMNHDLVDDIQLSQDLDSGLTDLVRYGTLAGKIVGCRFYNGHVTNGEMVLLKREPNNEYDSNAIRVDNVRGEQIGHIPRGTAAKLAGFMDNRTLRVEATITGEKSYYDCPIQLQFFGSEDPVQRASIKDEMKKKNIPTNEMRELERREKARQKERAEREKELKKLQKQGKNVVAAPSATGQAWTDGTGRWVPRGVPEDGLSLEELAQGAERFRPRLDFDSMVEKFGLNEKDLADMPRAQQPEALESELLPYQLQGLQWMLDHEHPNPPEVGSDRIVQLWKRMDKDITTNIATNFSLKGQMPDFASGGILADDMGLGKTIQVISLIVADRGFHPKQKKQESATLILAPLSVMSNWSGQIAHHIKSAHGLKVLTYHGSNRLKLSTSNIGDFDVVITTYETVMSEYWQGGKTAKAVPRPDGLFSITWRRVVLDEGHIIRNPQAKKSVAAYNLLANSRWVLTGTPIVNTLKDLYSMVKFLKLSGGVDRWELFNGAIVRPVTQSDARGQYLLQTLMQSICLRRKKEMAFIDLKLPELTEYVHRITFAPEEQERYDALQAEAKGQLDRYQSGKSKNQAQAYTHLLEVLLRLRQTCNHWKLCGEGRIVLPDDVGEALDLTPENRAALTDMLRLKIEAQDDCPVCFETLNIDPVITACTHVFCYACAERFIETQHKCPMCRAELDGVDKLLRLPQEEVKKEKAAFNIEESSSKIEMILNILRAAAKKKGTKTIIFSQWTRFLDVVQKQLEANNFKFCRIDGTMKGPQRDEALQQLEHNPECTIMLASLSVCSVGLNLVAANQVILADTWWAPAIEDQAVDRVHRLGQKQPCTVFRLVMEESIEESVLKIQEDKRKLMQLAFAEKKGKRDKSKNTRLHDIERLLNPTSNNTAAESK